MNHLRRIAAVATAFAGSILASLLVVPDAFAMRLAPPDGRVGSSITVTHHGMAGWEIALIVAASSAAAIVLFAGLRRWSRHVPRRAFGHLRRAGV